MIDIVSLLDNEFKVVPAENGDALIKPEKTKWNWAEDERIYRSTIIGPDGNIVSTVFPKFFNRGESFDDDEDFEEAFDAGRVTFYEKLDGTLIIMNYRDGVVRFRTRGQHDLGEFEKPVMDLVLATNILEQKSNEFKESVSFLFEYVGPENQIVLKYPEPQLIYIGCVSHVNPWKPMNMDANVVGQYFGVPIVQEVSLDDPNSIRDWTDREGVVGVWVDDNGRERRIKLKSDWYFQQHKLRWGLTEKKLRQFLFVAGTSSIQESINALKDKGLDFEMIMTFTDAIATYHMDRQVVRHKMADTFALVTESRGKESRKDAVEFLQDRLGSGQGLEYFPLAMAIYDRKTDDRIKAHWGALLLGEPVTNVLRLIEEGNVLDDGDTVRDTQ